MSKVEKPVLSGQRLKARKRDEKGKTNVPAFRDFILKGIEESGNDLTKVSTFLTNNASQDYRRYAEPLIDILIAGGVLAPGGTIVDGIKTDVCVFGADQTEIRGYFEVFETLIRRFGYLEQSFLDDLRKVLRFLTYFSEEKHNKLSAFLAICLNEDLVAPTFLDALLSDHLLKDNIGLNFLVAVLQKWLSGKDMPVVRQALRRATLDGKLLNLLPVHIRTTERLISILAAANLDSVIDYVKDRETSQIRTKMGKQAKDLIRNDGTPKELQELVQSFIENGKLSYSEAAPTLWAAIADSYEAPKGSESEIERLFLDHVKTYYVVLLKDENVTSGEMPLLTRIQGWCHTNTSSYTNAVFPKIVQFFYLKDILSEETIFEWYKNGLQQHNKSKFTAQLKGLITWLENAEEESGKSGQSESEDECLDKTSGG